jgi:ABC-type sulfate/molybdate transport systems ATPase subunit
VVLVTHHVEEIMLVFSHLLVLKNGKVLAAGEKSKVLKTKNRYFVTEARRRNLIFGLTVCSASNPVEQQKSADEKWKHSVKCIAR